MNNTQPVTFQEVIQDIINNAGTERGRLWLEQARYEYPQFFAEFEAALDEPPERVIARIAKYLPDGYASMVTLMQFSPQAKGYVTRLQAYFRQQKQAGNRQPDGTAKRLQGKEQA